MPRLVDIVGIAGDRINLASCRVELLIEIGQILQLCGADKSKVRRIEEKYTPLVQYIRFAHGAKSVVLITLHGKIGDFFLDQGHGLSSFILNIS